MASTVAAPIPGAPPEDILRYQDDLIRTGQGFPLGRLMKIAIGPCASYRPPENDPFIAKFGRFMDLRDRPLPISKSLDGSMLLLPAPISKNGQGEIALPDVPDPSWLSPPRTKEEIEGVVDKDATALRRKSDSQAPAVMRPLRADEIDPNRYTPRMLPQRLEDRTSDVLAGTRGRVLVFQPLLYLVVQPEKGLIVTSDGQKTIRDSNLRGTAWRIQFYPNPADRTDAALLVDRMSGWCHVFGGLWDIQRAVGED